MKHQIQVAAARVAYRDDGGGPPLLLLHGCPFSSYIWRHVIPLLRPHFRCIAPDVLGLGDTETPADADWSLPAQAATVVGLLDTLDIDAAHVVAHDHGAAIAQLTPELLRGYIAANLADRHRRAKTRRFLAGQLDPANNRATSDALPGLRSFNHPTLIVWGRDDPHFGPEWAERLRRDIPGVVRLELLPDAGHLLMEERPHELARLLIDFLTEQQPAPTPTDTEVRHG